MAGIAGPRSFEGLCVVRINVFRHPGDSLELHTPISMLAYSKLYQHIAELGSPFLDASSTSCIQSGLSLKDPIYCIQAIYVN